MTDHQVARHARDATMTCVSQAPLEKMKAYKRRMGWDMPGVSAAETDFNGPASARSPSRTASCSNLRDHGTRPRVPDGLLRDPRPGAERRDDGDASQFWIRRQDEY
jgi:predicted dithiol-disulfide oxidoreductase (DUF899 family)